MTDHMCSLILRYIQPECSSGIAQALPVGSSAYVRELV